ncbi:MAG: hypothetical protein MUF21_05840 [Gemmatimonadaceae bacterium]|jgi:hypothetical protein|nr:hypothetical protein [Gemmatimonadaceae bacterium]
MHRSTSWKVAAPAALLLALAGCGDSSTEPGGESELITRVTLTLTPQGGGAAQTAVINDPDGNGPQAPQAQTGTLSLARGTTYTGTVRFENAVASPIEDITAEVRAEANEHRVFYTASTTGVTITTTDTDGQNRPLGLAFTAAVGATAAQGAGTARVLLCHYDSSPKVGTATSCTGETDIDLTFAYTVP